jgi:hypothetical protein
MVRRDVMVSLSACVGGRTIACYASPAGASPVPVSIGAPVSRPQVLEGDLCARAGYQKSVRWREPLIGERTRGPQRKVKPTASTDSQPAGRAAHVTAKATLQARAPKLASNCGGVWGAARVSGEARIRVILERLGLELHAQKTRRVNLYDGKEGFDFLGCHLHKRLSGRLWEQKRQRLYFLHRWPSQRSMQRIRQRVKELTPKSRCHADLRVIIADLNPVLRGWGQYFRTGNANTHFNRLDSYVWRRLLALRIARKGRNVQPGEVTRWSSECFHSLGLYRLRGTVRYPGSPFWASHNAIA